jgi:hypothetical protein
MGILPMGYRSLIAQMSLFHLGYGLASGQGKNATEIAADAAFDRDLPG